MNDKINLSFTITPPGDAHDFAREMLRFTQPKSALATTKHKKLCRCLYIQKNEQNADAKQTHERVSAGFANDSLICRKPGKPALSEYPNLCFHMIDEQTRDLYRQGISAFGGISPTYRIALGKDAPAIVWDFHSLPVMVQMCFSFMLTDKENDMRMCKHCKKAFLASRNARTVLMSTNQGRKKGWDRKDD